MSENGSYKLRNLEDGADWVEKVKGVRQFCFAMEIRGSAKRLSGNKDYPPEEEVNLC